MYQRCKEHQKLMKYLCLHKSCSAEKQYLCIICLRKNHELCLDQIMPLGSVKVEINDKNLDIEKKLEQCVGNIQKESHGIFTEQFSIFSEKMFQKANFVSYNDEDMKSLIHLQEIKKNYQIETDKKGEMKLVLKIAKNNKKMKERHEIVKKIIEQDIDRIFRDLELIRPEMCINKLSINNLEFWETMEMKIKNGKIYMFLKPEQRKLGLVIFKNIKNFLLFKIRLIPKSQESKKQNVAFGVMEEYTQNIVKSSTNTGEKFSTYLSSLVKVTAEKDYTQGFYDDIRFVEREDNEFYYVYLNVIKNKFLLFDQFGKLISKNKFEKKIFFITILASDYIIEISSEF